jgi:hypothetical protein
MQFSQPSKKQSMLPSNLEWQFGPIPDVETVGYDSRIAVVMEVDGIYIGTAYPWGNNLNTLRWSMSGGGFGLRVPPEEPCYWAWLKKGTLPVPEDIQLPSEAKARYAEWVRTRGPRYCYRCRDEISWDIQWWGNWCEKCCIEHGKTSSCSCRVGAVGSGRCRDCDVIFWKDE